jgi:hypothetical protein
MDILLTAILVPALAKVGDTAVQDAYQVLKMLNTEEIWDR